MRRKDGVKDAAKEPIHLNNEIIKALPAGEQFWDDDPKAAGFGVRVYESGKRSFFLNYRLDGRQRQMTIGPFPRWSVAEAREEAKELRKRIDRGDDPAEQRRERRTAPTIADLVARYVAEHMPTKSQNPKRLKDEKRILAEIERKLGAHTRVADVHGGDLAAMHRRITESGRPVRANRILAIASKMFALSLVPMEGENAPWRNALQGNPAKGIKRNHEEPKERFFNSAELAAISDALGEYSDGVAADCIRLMMLTGCRPSEAKQARWSEFDDEPGLWVKPSAHTKQKKVHRLPLNPPALDLIATLRTKRAEDYSWVFPQRRKNRAGKPRGGHVTDLNHCWSFVRKRANLRVGDRPYDLRHSYASHGAAGGLSLYVIGKLLGHTQQATTQRYAHVGDDPLRDATNKIAAAITAKAPPANVTSLPCKGRRS